MSYVYVIVGFWHWLHATCPLVYKRAIMATKYHGMYADSIVGLYRGLDG